MVLSWLSVETLARTLDFKPDTIRDWIKAGRFGPHTVKVNGDEWRVSELGVQHLLQHPDAAPVAAKDDTIKARTAGELKRKASA